MSFAASCASEPRSPPARRHPASRAPSLPSRERGRVGRGRLPHWLVQVSLTALADTAGRRWFIEISLPDGRAPTKRAGVPPGVTAYRNRIWACRDDIATWEADDQVGSVGPGGPGRDCGPFGADTRHR